MVNWQTGKDLCEGGCCEPDCDFTPTNSTPAVEAHARATGHEVYWETSYRSTIPRNEKTYAKKNKGPKEVKL